MPPALRIRPYKDFLTPALHRRFSSAAAFLLGVCYVEAIVLGGWNGFFWSWFPFSKVGLRMGLLFICAFSIFVLRVAQLHVGLRTTNSGFQTFKQYAIRFETLQTTGWYLFSAWLFSEVYIFSAPHDANIKWITDAKNNERPRLNERPIYLTNFFLTLALLQAGIHLFYDYDRVELPLKKTKPRLSPDQGPSQTDVPLTQLKALVPSLLATSFKRAIIMTCIGPFIYSIFVRHIIWSYALMFAKLWWNLPKTTALPAITPFHWRILARSFTGGFMLVWMWEVGNAAFSVYVAQEPLKNERPITYESRDPNGSLLTGLKGKKLQTRAFAFWELVYIGQRFEGRRKVIFEDIDRKGGSTWSQILNVCLETIEGMGSRITEYQNPISTTLRDTEEPQLPSLPRLTAPLKEDNIYTKSPLSSTTGTSIAQVVGSIAKAHGQTPSDPLSVKSRRLVDRATSAVLTPEQQENAFSQAGMLAFAGSYATQILQSPLGWPFRQDFRRRIASVVLGSPYGDVGIIVDAVDALTRFSVCSLKEDQFGNVQRDVPTIIRTFTAAISRLEIFKHDLALHWTDVGKAKESPEIDNILAALKSGLSELLETFGSYREDLRISMNEMAAARNAATSPVQIRNPEMQQT